MVLVWSRLALSLAAALLSAAPPAQADVSDENDILKFPDIHKAFTSLVSTSLQTKPWLGVELGMNYTHDELRADHNNNRSKELPPNPINPYCCYTYFEDANGWLRFFSKPANWSTAERVCEQDGAELSFVLKIGGMMLNMVPRPPVPVHAGVLPNWTDDADFVIALNYEMNTPLSENMETIDWKEEDPFICYKKTVTKCGPADNGYELDNRTGHCYKFMREPATWYAAFHECQVDRGDLVVIHDEMEAQVVRDIYESNPEDTLSGQTRNNVAFLGVFKNKTDKWATLDDYGKTLKEIGYDRWSPGEPNNAGGNERCGSVRRNGLLQDESCDLLLPYICERQEGLAPCPLTEIDERCNNYSY